MERKKVLVIGMFDSIHLARWLSQFEDQNIEFVLFPSKKFKYLNFDLAKLIKSKNNSAKFVLPKPYFFFKYIGYLDYILNFLFKIINRDFRKITLKRILESNKFNYVHAIEIQGAGYLYQSLPKRILNQNTLILTNYGSDIYYFKDIQEHNKKIKSVLETTKFYSGECQRDYEIALGLGFTGEFLPCIPNAGGFKNDIFKLNTIASEDRNLIVAKCYGGVFGLGGLIIDALSAYLVDKPEIKIVIHSVTDDLLEKSKEFKSNFPNQVSYFKVREKIPRALLLDYLSEARVYIGASKSDGISTSFLEALCLGAYPIQTNTSCANEWINLGFTGSIIEPEAVEILNALNTNYNNYDLNQKRIHNLTSAKKYLSYNLIKTQALKFYEHKL
jgi:glycosyltransferase involved in cell wall biosynthesis